MFKKRLRTTDAKNSPRGPVIWDDPYGTNFSQRTIHGDTTAKYAEMMRSGQWDWNRPDAPLDRIILEDGTKVTLDNRRLDAALEANQQRIPFIDHQARHPLPKAYRNDAYWRAENVRTWGDVLSIRTLNNRLPLEGTRNRPRRR